MSYYNKVFCRLIFCQKINTKLVISALEESGVCSSSSSVSDSLLDT